MSDNAKSEVSRKTLTKHSVKLLTVILTNSLICLAPIHSKGAAANNRRSTSPGNQLKGAIKTIDSGSKTISIGGKTITVTANTMIVKGAKPIDFADLKAGMAVRVNTFRLADRLTAVSIKLESADSGK